MQVAPAMTPRHDVWPKMLGAATTVREAMKAGVAAAMGAARGAHGVKENVKGTVVEATGTVVDAAATVAQAPGNVAAEVRQHMDEWAHALTTKIANAAALGILAMFALVLLTIAVVVVLNRWLGDPYGTLAIAALYAVGALAFLVRMRTARDETKAQEA